MHYHAEVWIPNNENVKEQIEAAMEPYCEDCKGFWDWYQIGGRWSGSHIPDYNPNEDPKNLEICSLCDGTGTRPDMEVTDGCNSCHGNGVVISWPTQWEPHQRDAIKVSELPASMSAYTLVLPDEVLHNREWDGETLVKGKLPGNPNIKDILASKSITGGYLVTVDYHC